ncbi:haloalkane dehalogenase [Mycobacteroides sp. H001]|uniref:haloalkane dehalogenase n=1 Tax=unclassified Mycobacteroides TaxID=2618759 RepID=UPI000712CC2F|nr:MULTISPECIES: haloalkane dehalogenase [unclassified Mycobacteroides]KRQ20422.1 haloalkane dehalogenase [Mycobacteroides sp. H072]KRQ34233.1 haloalkane dehalogenase [Mycobacteroides sp. H002]KRQ52050.1 haloalkane dehalogenase [Mycobacteroides sp. H054]KRQ71323.1 haloalkane dehalogenase [Mycobacteroides sp. H001]
MTNQRPAWVKKTENVHGLTMSYVELGQGDPIVFLHGNPTSSYLWRNIAPAVADHGRCIVPDLIGMGDSDKLPDSGPDSYRFIEHRRYLDRLLEQLGVDDRVVFVVHDWGSALGFDWSRRHPGAVRGLAYMEAIVAPMSAEEFHAREVFTEVRSPAGDDMVLRDNVFVEKIFPRSIQRDLTDEEMGEFRRPFLRPGEDRRPTLTWPRQIPLDGQPHDVTQIVDDYSNWLSGSQIPKLFINAEPGALLTGRMRELCRAWPNQREVSVNGIHFIQEDSPDQISVALQLWLSELVG